MILKELLDLLPASNASESVGVWFNIKRIPSLLQLVNLIFDLILDVAITIDMSNWNSYKNDIPCNIFAKVTNGSAIDNAICNYTKFYTNPAENIFSCELSLNSSVQKSVCGVLSTSFLQITNHTIQPGPCWIIDEVTMRKSTGCTLHQMDEYIASGIAISVLLLTQLFYILVLKTQWRKFQLMYLYIFGNCCVEKQDEKRKRFVLFGIATFLICLLLPIVTKIFVIVIISISLFQKERNSKILNILKIDDVDYRKKLEEIGKSCKYCEGCVNSSFHVCIFCGRDVKNGCKKDKLEHEYKKKIVNPTQNVEKIKGNLLDLDRLDRFTTGSLENCFMPILQLLLVFPTMLKYFSNQSLTVNDDDEGLTTEEIWVATTYWLKFAFTIVSIATSLISLSSTAMDLHFSREKKQSSKNDSTAKTTFLIATSFQISSRLLLLIAFILVVLKELPLAPLYVVVFIPFHWAIVLLSKYLTHRVLLNKNIKKQSTFKFGDALASSILSAYTYNLWDISFNTEAFGKLSRSIDVSENKDEILPLKESVEISNVIQILVTKQS